LKQICEQLTYANVIATLALFLALGGVGSRQLKKGAVIGAKIKSGAVTGATVKDGSLSVADLAPGTIPSGSGTPASTPAGPPGTVGPPGEPGQPGAPGAGLAPASFIDAGLPNGEPGCGTHQGFVNWEPAVAEHVGYHRSPDGFVHLKGTALQCNPDSGVVFFLPPGYRPAASVFFFGPIPTIREPTIRAGSPPTGGATMSKTIDDARKLIESGLAEIEAEATRLGPALTHRGESGDRWPRRRPRISRSAKTATTASPNGPRKTSRRKATGRAPRGSRRE
jgi:hypothetical protein